MNIAFLLGGFTSGGIARVTSVLANNFIKNESNSVHAISFVHENGKENYILNGNIIRHHLFEKKISMTKALLTTSCVRNLRKIIKTNRVDILICCDAIFFPLGILATRGVQTKCLCWEHTSPFVNNDHKYQNFCRTFAIKRCDKFITLTKFAENYYKEKYNEYSSRIVHIYNPIADECFISKKYNIDSKKIISVGRLSYPKNFDRLIKIANEVLPAYPDWSWDIFGDGELRETLIKEIEVSRVKNQINLMGQVSNIYEQYQKYSFFVMTSRYEGFPMSLIEAGANKLPLISFDIYTGPNEIISNSVNGFLVSPKSDEDMIETIRKMIENANLRKQMSANNENIIESFSTESVLLDWSHLFEEVLKGKDYYENFDC